MSIQNTKTTPISSTDKGDSIAQDQPNSESPTKQQPKELMAPDHRRWHEFINLLEGPKGCNFHEEIAGDPKSLTWNCDSSGECPIAMRILLEMGFTPDEAYLSVCEFQSRGGSCDCEIYFNVACE